MLSYMFVPCKTMTSTLHQTEDHSDYYKALKPRKNRIQYEWYFFTCTYKICCYKGVSHWNYTLRRPLMIFLQIIINKNTFTKQWQSDAYNRREATVKIIEANICIHYVK